MIQFTDECLDKDARVCLEDTIDLDSAVIRIKAVHDMLNGGAWNEPHVRAKLQSMGIVE